MGAIADTPDLDGPDGPPHEDTLYYWAKRYVESCDYNDENPENPHADAELEYCEDNLRRLLEAQGASNLQAAHGRATISRMFGQGIEEGRGPRPDVQAAIDKATEGKTT